jgi:hypothetical protein
LSPWTRWATGVLPTGISACGWCRTADCCIRRPYAPARAARRGRGNTLHSPPGVAHAAAHAPFQCSHLQALHCQAGGSGPWGAAAASCQTRPADRFLGAHITGTPPPLASAGGQARARQRRVYQED